MTTDQALAFAVMGAAVALFIWGKLRYDLVALMALVVGVLVGVIPAEEMFSGFSNDLIWIIASVLVLSAAIARSGLIDRALAPVLGRLTDRASADPGVCGRRDAPVDDHQEYRRARHHDADRAAERPQDRNACLATPDADVLRVPAWRPRHAGRHVAQRHRVERARVDPRRAVPAVRLCARRPRRLRRRFRLSRHRALLHPHRPRRARPAWPRALETARYVTEMSIPEDSEWIGKPFSELDALSTEDTDVLSVVTEKKRGKPSPDRILVAGDHVIVEGEQAALEKFAAAAKLTLTGDRHREENESADDVRVVEGVIAGDSSLAGRSVSQSRLHERYGLSLLAVSREGSRLATELRSIRLRGGDVVIFKADEGNIGSAFAELARPAAVGTVDRAGREAFRLRAAGPARRRRARHRHGLAADPRRLRRRCCRRAGAARHEHERGLSRGRWLAAGSAGLPHPGQRGDRANGRGGADRRAAVRNYSARCRPGLPSPC